MRGFVIRPLTELDWPASQRVLEALREHLCAQPQQVGQRDVFLFLKFLQAACQEAGSESTVGVLVRLTDHRLNLSDSRSAQPMGLTELLQGVRCLAGEDRQDSLPQDLPRQLDGL
ncbi:MAG TPA: hypothetical protein DDX89_08185 [Candidatus Omnitrophica bacterium]|nr:hypothetical protein [Candidatus Omnitrophota bacterium]